MGASKRLAELVCQDFTNTQSNTRFAIVRFGNVLGSSGSVVPLFKQQIAAGGPVTVTHADVTRYFSALIPEAATISGFTSWIVSQQVAIFSFLAAGEPVKILDLARKMIILSGKKPLMGDVRPTEVGEIGNPHHRTPRRGKDVRGIVV